MPQDAIFGPFLATMLLTLAVWITLYMRRIAFIQRIQLSPAERKIPGRLAALSPPEVSNPSDNFKNLFEVPVLFYAISLHLFVTGQVDAIYVGAAWVFFVFRALHSAVHCTFNHVMLRFSVYAVAALAVWFMILRATLAHVRA